MQYAKYEFKNHDIKVICGLFGQDCKDVSLEGYRNHEQS